MATHVAHDVINYGLNVGSGVLTSVKSKSGVMKWTVEKVERPVNSVLKSKVGVTALKVADNTVTMADNTIDKAMNTGVYTSTSHVVKSTYNNRVVPASTAVKKTISSTTTAVTSPVVNAYTGVLTLADKTVEYALPEKDAKLAKEDKAIAKTVVGISRKITRRSVRKVAATRKMVATTVEQSKPANVKKNAVALFKKTLAGADRFVDTYLPEKDGLVAKNPVMLAKKVFKRSSSRTITVVKKMATAVTNAPMTFKKSCIALYKNMTLKAMKLRNLKLKVKLMSVQDMKAKVTPLIEAAQAKGALYVAATDKLLLNYQYTAAVRNFGVNFYLSKLTPAVNPLLTKLLGNKPATAMTPVKAVTDSVAKSVAAKAASSAPVPAPAPAPEEKKKKKGKKASPVLPEPELEDLAPTYDAPEDEEKFETMDM